MKKAYLNPSIEVVTVTTGCQICIGSPNTSSPTNLEGVVDGGDDPGDFSRRRSSWSDED